ANNMEKLMELIVHSEFEYPPHITQPARDLIDRVCEANPVGPMEGQIGYDFDGTGAPIAIHLEVRNTLSKFYI
ncbi:hypothetical protein SARC_16788, partial [Sphaeroforma arctica JP610]